MTPSAGPGAQGGFSKMEPLAAACQSPPATNQPFFPKGHLGRPWGEGTWPLPGRVSILRVLKVWGSHFLFLGHMLGVDASQYIRLISAEL